MNITLNAHQAQFVRQAVASGDYRDASQVIDDALALLESSEKLSGDDQECMDRELDKRLEQLERGEFLTPEQLRQNLAARKKAWLLENQIQR